MPLRSLALAAGLTGLVDARSLPLTARDAVPTRTYVVRQVNGRGLPFRDRFSTTPGYEHRTQLEQALIRLGGDGAFTMTVYGAYKDAPRDMPGFAGQTRDEVVHGHWTRQGTAVTLHFAPNKKGKQVAPAAGQLTGDRLTLRYTIGWDYGVKAGTRTYTFTAVHDPSYL